MTSVGTNLTYNMTGQNYENDIHVVINQILSLNQLWRTNVLKHGTLTYNLLFSISRKHEQTSAAATCHCYWSTTPSTPPWTQKSFFVLQTGRLILNLKCKLSSVWTGGWSDPDSLEIRSPDNNQGLLTPKATPPHKECRQRGREKRKSWKGYTK